MTTHAAFAKFLQQTLIQLKQKGPSIMLIVVKLIKRLGDQQQACPECAPKEQHEIAGLSQRSLFKQHLSMICTKAKPHVAVWIPSGCLHEKVGHHLASHLESSQGCQAHNCLT